MIHALITLIICLYIFYFQFPLMLVFLPAAFYLGREIAQAEYRYVEWFCCGKYSRMPWYAIFVPKAWTIKEILDWLLPLAVSACFYFLLKAF